jgi:chemotaxis protein CheD
MAFCTAQQMADQTAVGMAQSVVASEPARLTTILGSCVAITLYSPHERTGMMSHVVLPQSAGDKSYPAKFADTAVPHMIATLKDRGIWPGGLIAKVTGGACMFGDGKFMQIGDANVQAVLKALGEAGIQVTGQDVNGTLGRRVCFDLANGSVTVECIGHPSRTI